MSFGVGFGDLVKFVEISAKTYKYGFSKAQRAHTLYGEFGDNIKGLATNLDDLHKIIGFIGGYGAQFLDSSYMESLVDIIGDFRRTIQDCDKFMKDKERFSWQGDFVTNIVWNFSIASEVQTLKDRVAFLNIKLMTVLKTLDLRMANQLHIDIFRIHQDLALRIDGAQENIIQAVQAAGDGILDYLRSQSGNPVPTTLRPTSNGFDIPISLEALFQQQLQGSSFDADPDQFPLVPGLDAVVFHLYTADTISADSRERKLEREWLALAKALWIIARVKSGQEYKDACSVRASNNLERQMNELGITVASYVKRLEIQLSEMVKRLNVIAVHQTPDVIRQTFIENPEMWLELKEDAGPTPTWELDYSENIMDASLRGPYRGFEQSLHLFKLTDVDLKLVITDTPTPSPGGGNSIAQRTNNIINVDIRRSRFIPLYAANNSSTGGALNITFQGDRLASGSSALIFNKRSELFKFQHAITGYQVILESLGVGVVTYAAARMIGGNQSEYTGRLQLWRAKKPQNTTAQQQGSSAITAGSSNSNGSTTTMIAELPASPPLPSTTFSPISPSAPFAIPRPSTRSSIATQRRRDSSLTVSDSRYGSSPSDSRFGSSPSRRDSTWTINSTATSATATTAVSLADTRASFTTTVVSGDGTIGVILDPPIPSMLVLMLLKTTKRGDISWSTLAIDIDETTIIDPSACKCRRDPEKCLRVVVQKAGSGGTLSSIRQDAGTDLEAWNLAALGGAQRKFLEKEQSGARERLSWTAIDFGELKEKKKFVSDFNKLKDLLRRERAAYNLTMSRVRS